MPPASGPAGVSTGSLEVTWTSPLDCLYFLCHSTFHSFHPFESSVEKRDFNVACNETTLHVSVMFIIIIIVIIIILVIIIIISVVWR